MALQACSPNSALSWKSKWPTEVLGSGVGFRPHIGIPYSAAPPDFRDAKSSKHGKHGKHICAIFLSSLTNFWSVDTQLVHCATVLFVLPCIGTLAVPIWHNSSEPNTKPQFWRKFEILIIYSLNGADFSSHFHAFCNSARSLFDQIHPGAQQVKFGPNTKPWTGTNPKFAPFPPKFTYLPTTQVSLIQFWHFFQKISKHAIFTFSLSRNIFCMITDHHWSPPGLCNVNIW